MLVEKLDLVGKQFGNCSILGELGRGGMAIVYKADELSLNRVVALKVLSPKISDDETMIKRFHREAQAVAKLSHPNIVHIYAIGEEEGIHYFTMEYIKGRTLRQVLKEQKAIPLGKALVFVIQAAEALGEAHKAGLVHRDVKPSNIMLDPAERIKVADFGLARLMDASSKLTVDGSFLGTPHYMSPEQCEGQPVDRRSDIYSLGVTFYEILTGKPPVEGGSPGSIIAKVIEGKLRPIREIDPTVPKEVAAVITKMLAKDVSKRYRDMDEVIAALQPLGALCDEEDATMVSLAGGAALQPKKKPYWDVVMVVVVLLLLIGGGIMLVQHLLSGLQDGEKDGVSPDPVAVAQQGVETSQVNVAANIKPGPVSVDPQGIQVPHANVAAKVVPSPVPVISVKPDEKPVAAKLAPVVPAANSVLVTVSGYGNVLRAARTYTEAAMKEHAFEVIDNTFAAGKNIATVARHRVVVEASLLGTSTLHFYGSTSQKYKVLLTMKALDTANGKIAGGPVSTNLEFTSNNLEENLKEAVGDLSSKIKKALLD